MEKVTNLVYFLIQNYSTFKTDFEPSIPAEPPTQSPAGTRDDFPIPEPPEETPEPVEEVPEPTPERTPESPRKEQVSPGPQKPKKVQVRIASPEPEEPEEIPPTPEIPRVSESPMLVRSKSIGPGTPPESPPQSPFTPVKRPSFSELPPGYTPPVGRRRSPSSASASDMSSQSETAMSTTPPINIKQMVDSVYQLTRANSQDLFTNLRDVAVSVRDMKNVLVNYPDSALQSVFGDVSDAATKLVKTVKSVAEDPDRSDAQIAIKLASRLSVMSVAKMLYAYEEIRDTEAQESIVATTQTAANCASQILRALYSGSYGDLAELAPEYAENSKILVETIQDKMIVLNHDSREKARALISKIEVVSKKLGDQIKTVKSSDVESFDLRRSAITSITKELVLSLREINGIFEDPSFIPDNGMRANYLESYNLLSRAMKQFSNSRAAEPLVDKMRPLVAHFRKLREGFDSSTEQLQALGEILSCLSTIYAMVQTETDEAVLNNITGIISSDSDVSYGLKLHSQLTTTRRFSYHVMINVAAITAGGNLRQKFPHKVALNHAVYETACALATMLDGYQAFRTFVETHV
eukprot:TRINITY_DN4318_c0_g1_i4.p1 TRINITY_DN4318_c0_g1~~TRINITY_DN4318_c0_g1_i4.p1  ORF type:complete len:580 (-),score=156.73 TRINITY_DN4318_c0_g1_i4:16-1755(-)